MALVINDRVKETSTTTGTGTLTLDGAETGFETFSSAIGNTNTTYYAIEIPNTVHFEVGLGTVGAGTLSRDTVISSSNSDNPVNFPAGTKNVFCTLPASKAVVKDASDNVIFGDNEKANFGDSNDLQIYHTGGSSYISDDGTGHLNLRTNGSDIRMIKTDGTIMLQAVPDNRVDLYYNGSKKFGTTSTGIDVTGRGKFTGTSNTAGIFFDNTTFGTYDWEQFQNDLGQLIFTITGTGGAEMTLRNTNTASYTNAELFVGGSIAATTDNTLTLSNKTLASPTITGDVAFDTNTLYVDSSNNRVGIGTTSPAERLHIFGGDILFQGATPILKFQPTADSQQNKIDFAIAAGTVQSSITGGGVDGQSLKFDTASNTRMTINSACNVGIGTTNPGHLLQVESTGSASIMIRADSDNVDETHVPSLQMTSDGNTSATYKIGIEGNAGTEFTGSLANAPYIHASNATSQPLQLAHVGSMIMTLRDGRVGIGTSSPARDTLHVHSTVAPGTYVHLTNSSTGSAASDGSSIFVDTNGNFEINNRESASIRLKTGSVVAQTITTTETVINDDGVDTDFRVESVNNTDMLHVNAGNDKVGIGGFPSEKLSVIGSNNTSAATLKVKDTDGRGILIESPYSGSGVGFIGTHGTNSALGFKVNGTEYGRFGTNGYFGIGTSNPSSALDVSGGITADSNNNSIIHDITRQTGATNASRPVINLTAKNTAADVSDGFGPSLEFKLQDNTADTQLGAIGFIRDGADGSGAFVVGQDSQFLHSLPQFLIDSSGNVGIGTTNPTRKLTIAGGNNAKIQFTDGGIQSLYFGDAGSDFAGYFHYDHTNDQFRINTSSNTVFTGGNVGIGSTTAPSTLLHLSSSDPQITITDTDGTGSQVIKAVTDNLEIDSANALILDGDQQIMFNDGGTNYGAFVYYTGSNTWTIHSQISDADFVINGNDGGVQFNALTFDMSEAGAATFNDKIVLGANKVIEFGDSSDTIKGDGTKITVNSSGRLDLLGTSVFLNGSGTTAVSLSSQGVTFGQFIKENTNNLVLKSSISDGDFIIRGNDGGSNVDALTFDMSEAGDATFNSNIFLGDNKKANFGDSNDLQIFHNANNSVILDNGTGSLSLQSNGTYVGLYDAANTNHMVLANVGADVQLYHNGSQKLATTASGVTVTGSLQTQDLVLNNLSKDSPNSVDGTRGHWRVQEGAEDLYLINETTGKKYKFKIEEVQ